MANPEVTKRMEALSPAAKLLLIEFLADRLESRTKEFTRIPEADFKTQKGRCFELEDLIKYLEGKRA